MTNLKQNSNFEPFSQLTQLPGIRYFSSKEFMDFDSRKSIYDRLLEAIINGKNNKVGLYGIAGSGKTTLAKEVGKKVDELKLFDKVIMVVVSKPPNILNIQQEIAGQIGLQFQEATQLTKAQRLSEGLKNKKILIILDDLWEHLNLEDIGIPLVEGCHILLTTRLRNVCGSMGCEPKIELPLITKEEAWDLFKKHADLCNDPSNMFGDVGEKIVDECKGLPIAIVAVGRSLKGKHIEAWESALWRLRHFQPLNVGQGFVSAYSCLEWSYSSLPSSTAKSLLLLCSMFPEDHEIHKEDLIRFGMKTLESEESIVTIEDARRVIFDALEILLDSCLLVSIEKKACVKMHDLVRDVALWIAKKQGQVILVDSSEVSNILLGYRQNLKDTKALSFWDLDDNFNLSYQLHCLTLEILLLQPHGFIEDLGAVKALKVLALIKYGFEWGFRKGLEWGFQKRSSVCSIPQSIVSLTYLHTLCIRGKKLGDISLLGEFTTLEILDLRGSLFDELPAGIVDIKMLKLLDIYDCRIEKSPIEVIGRSSYCPLLDEIIICNCSEFERLIDKDAAQGDPLLHDIQDYPHGKETDSAYVGVIAKRFNQLQNEQSLILFLRLKSVHIERSGKKKGILEIQVRGRVKDDEESIKAQEPPKLDSELSELTLDGLPELEYIWKGPTQIVSLHRLENVLLWSCPKLKSIFTLVIVASLPELRTLQVYDCEEWEGIFCEESLKNLSSSNICFPKPKQIFIRSCNRVRWLLSYSVASHCPSLEFISIDNCSEFERLINREAAHGDPLLHDYPYHCPKLKSIFTLAIVTSLPELRRLEVEGCHEWEEIFCEESLKNLSTTSAVCFPKLETIRIWHCRKVRRVFSYSLASHCPSLKQITIWNCSQLERVVGAYEGEVAAHHQRLFPKLNDLDLTKLPKLREIYESYEFNHLPGTLKIENCPKISNIPLDDKPSSSGS
ncbi:disease resistance protein RFL1-like [Neltuma alba]|uniref:disease resistance protein RFL1-like n=1 Tax=Neltuma alba TaxID=207710 RepID=UPI0010A342D2|nr:disease resistance protein RFL1-like [Prosopis alba]